MLDARKKNQNTNKLKLAKNSEAKNQEIKWPGAVLFSVGTLATFKFPHVFV